MEKATEVSTQHVKQCPFCGGDNINIEYIELCANEKLWYVRCDGCGCNTGYRPTKDEAVKKWNRRVKEERDKALNDRQFLVDSIRNLLKKII